MRTSRSVPVSGCFVVDQRSVAGIHRLLERINERQRPVFDAVTNAHRQDVEESYGPLDPNLSEEQRARLAQRVEDRVAGWRSVNEREWGKVSIYAQCADHARRDFESLEALKAYANPYERRIQRLRVENALSHPIHISLDFDSADEAFRSGGIKYEITSDDDTVMYVSRDIADVIRECRQWFSFVRKISGFHVTMSLFTLLLSSFAVLQIFLIRLRIIRLPHLPP